MKWNERKKKREEKVENVMRFDNIVEAGKKIEFR